MSSTDKPWLKPAPSAPWPTQEQVDKAAPKSPVPQTPPIPPTPQTDSLSELDADIGHIARALIQNRCDTFVVIGISKDGEPVSMFRPGADPKPFTLVGALEMLKFRVMQTIEQPEADSQSNTEGEPK